MTTVVHLVVCLGMVVVVPLGLGLTTVAGAVRRYWWFAAVPGAVSVWLDRGTVAVMLASVYLAGTLVLVAIAARTALSLRRPVASDLALLTALVTPSIAALSLVAERGGRELFGFSLTVLSLTVAHFHFAGFAAALVSGLVAVAVPGRAGTLAAVSVPLGIGIVLIGFFAGDPVELAGAVVLTAGMWLVGWALLTEVAAADRLTRALLKVAAAVLVVTMLLAVGWALGHVAGTPYLPLEWMVATHGVANAVGFGLCAVLAWRRLYAARLAAPLAPSGTV